VGESKPFIVGLSFGTDYSVIALPSTKEAGQPPEIIANEDGDHKIPSVVAMASHGVLTATAAKQQAASNLANTATRFRDLIGLAFEDDVVATVSRETPVSIVESPADPSKPAWEFNVTPEDAEEPVTSHMTARQLTFHHLRRLRESAAGYLGKPVVGCILSHPPEWDQARKDELMAAANDAGFAREMSALMAEPVAAMLALDTLKPVAHPAESAAARISLIVDIGGRHTQSSLVATHASPSGSLYTLISHRSDPIGCAALDKLLASHFADEFCRKYKLGGPEEIGRRGLARLASACEATKRSLSSAGASTGVANVESLWDGVDLRGSINRVRWEGLMEPWVRSVAATIGEFVGSSQVSWDDISEVVLIGGGSK
jgi:molecular chaperone DnaK (HSP70)